MPKNFRGKVIVGTLENVDINFQFEMEKNSCNKLNLNVQYLREDKFRSIILMQP